MMRMPSLRPWGGRCGSRRGRCRDLDAGPAELAPRHARARGQPMSRSLGAPGSGFFGGPPRATFPPPTATAAATPALRLRNRRRSSRLMLRPLGPGAGRARARLIRRIAGERRWDGGALPPADCRPGRRAGSRRRSPRCGRARWWLRSRRARPPSAALGGRVPENGSTSPLRVISQPMPTVSDAGPLRRRQAGVALVGAARRRCARRKSRPKRTGAYITRRGR